MTLKKTGDYPLVISFYAGAEYYYQSAKNLQDDCKALGLDHHIVEVEFSPNTSWINICRYKIHFIQKCLTEFERSILWVDVDCRILRQPDIFLGTQVDFAAFLRSFKYLKEFDPVKFPRQFHPSIIFYNYSSVTKEFVDQMVKVEMENKDTLATDDYFLQEAWLRFEKEMSIILLPPSIISFSLPSTPDKCFYFGRSGSATEFKNQVTQHEISLYADKRIKQTLVYEANKLIEEEQYEHAVFMLERALSYDKQDFVLAQRIAKLITRFSKLSRATKFLENYDRESSSSSNSYTGRFLIDHYLLLEKYRKAEKIATKLIKQGGYSDQTWAQSRLMRIKMSLRATKLSSRDFAKRLDLWWMQSPYPGNFGDILNPYIIEKLTGIPPRYSSHKNSVIAIGSIIKFASSNTRVWGSGTPRMTDKLCKDSQYLAVRGPLTRQLILESGGRCPEIYGDPATFLPYIYQPPTFKKYKLGVICHHSHEEQCLVSSDVKKISVIRAGYEGIESFIDELYQCEKILSSSLHGLIVSHAYGIPARWFEANNSEAMIPGDGTKYLDYYLSLQIKQVTPLVLDLKNIFTVNLADFISDEDLPEKTINLRRLALAAPFQIKAEILEQF